MTRHLVAPVIETRRLRLRPLQKSDFEPVLRIWSDPENVRFVGGKPSTGFEAWRRIVFSAGFWPILGYGYWALEEKGSGHFIGMTGFADFKRDEPAGFSGDPEIGYVIDKTVHGQGYGREAMTACMAWMDETHGRQRTICLIEPENIASIKIAERLGYRTYGEGRIGDAAVLLMERI